MQEWIRPIILTQLLDFRSDHESKRAIQRGEREIERRKADRENLRFFES